MTNTPKQDVYPYIKKIWITNFSQKVSKNDYKRL